MTQVRDLIAFLESDEGSLGEALVSNRVLLSADQSGTPHLEFDGFLTEGRGSSRQRVSAEITRDMLEPFSVHVGVVGPHLLQPAPQIRIIPGKLAGEPHLVDTRIETRVLSVLSTRGFDSNGLIQLYPGLDSVSIRAALKLERQLQRNERQLAA